MSMLHRPFAINLEKLPRRYEFLFAIGISELTTARSVRYRGCYGNGMADADPGLE